MTFEPEEDRLTREQARQNRGTAGQWQMYGPHREKIEKLLVAATGDVGTGASLCVLGAGNCNDLDLNHLARLFAKIELVDIDPQALAEALRRQQAEELAQIQTRAPVDLVGLGAMLAAWKGLPPVPSAIDRAVDMVGRHEPFPGSEKVGGDVVLSPCLLSQLIEPVRLALGARHEKYPALRRAIVARHLRLVSELVKPGGRGVVVIDVACSDYVPELGQTKEEDVVGVMNGLLERGKYFAGLAPHELLAVLRADRALSEVRAHRPWLWHLSVRRSFVVYPISFNKR